MSHALHAKAMAKKRVWANQQCFCPLTHESTSADRAWQEWPRLSTTWSCWLRLAARAATRVSNRAEQAREANVQEMQWIADEFVCIETTVRVGQGADQPGRARDGSYASATCFACCLGCRDQATTAARPPRACARAACRPGKALQPPPNSVNPQNLELQTTVSRSRRRSRFGASDTAQSQSTRAQQPAHTQVATCDMAAADIDSE
jgi:hypothetical protein